ncbi:MAG: tripartite tricarboxylate transporter permease [Desulfobacterales bacterium]|nr:tripartite tricarboxylate transporter permease [Desulfobacterales bacterium]
MFEKLASGFALFASWYNFLAIFFGMLLGVIVGAIPGMTGTMAVALALPFTFYMDPVTGMLLLIGIYKGSIYGGSISAILIKTPGTPAAACTVLDGYPMAKRGEANKALQIALYSSCIADFISNLSLIFFAGFFASFALRFGPPEFFTLMCFSLTVIAGVSGDSLLKGAISGCTGLLLATIGLDLVYGTDRFCFSSADLMGGLGFIPVLIGVFALPEIFKNIGESFDQSQKIFTASNENVTFPEFKRCFKSIIRGSLMGVVIGAIPGIGGAPNAFMSYGEAKRTSKFAHNFGKGEIEGVAAAEAGNNGCCGSTLIPLLALGVPGDVITAILLGALMIHGLTPGPVLFQKHISIVYALFMGIMLSSVMMFVAGKLCIRGFSKIAYIRKSILFPVVLVLCFYGAYAVNTSTFDILIMILMGILGYFMLCFDLPAAPFLIAFILGPMFEENMRRSLLLSKGTLGIFFRSPICWIFIFLTVLSIFFIIKRNIGFHKR